ncbi:hypothetical protein SDC9_209271 [bioreactor metagenome]|uniref:Uncharacterized protein n=1 Tax=bioreactor metagenome TaxID=1076179 RepID=A0A645JPN1_9ZZZZ
MSPSYQAAYPGQQFGKGKGFHQIIVGPQFQPLDPVLNLVARGQEQHRHFNPGAAHTFEHLPAIETGKHHIQDQQVVVANLCEFQPLPSIASQIRNEARLGEALLQVITCFGFVFDDEYFHGWGVRADASILPQLTHCVERITDL